jgi:hypothetical protein
MTIEDLIAELELLFKLTEGLKLEIVSLSITDYDGHEILLQ